MSAENHHQILSDLKFIEHALRGRMARLTPRHQEKLLASKTLAGMRDKFEEASQTRGPLEQTAALREILTALEHRLIKLENREGKVSTPFLCRPRMHCWTQHTQISSVVIGERTLVSEGSSSKLVPSEDERPNHAP